MLGATAVVLILLLAASGAKGAPATAVSVLLGGGAFLYGLFWLLAGLRMPGLGSSHAAKESLKFLAVPGAGAITLGLLGTAFLCIQAIRSSDSQAGNL